MRLKQFHTKGQCWAKLNALPGPKPANFPAGCRFSTTCPLRPPSESCINVGEMSNTCVWEMAGTSLLHAHEAVGFFSTDMLPRRILAAWTSSCSLSILGVGTAEYYSRHLRSQAPLQVSGVSLLKPPPFVKFAACEHSTKSAT